MRRIYMYIGMAAERMVQAYYRFDVFRLRCAARIVSFMFLRIGVRQKTFERGLLLFAFAHSIVLSVNGTGPFWLRLSSSALIPVVTLWLGYMVHTAPYELRLWRLVTGRLASTRTMWVLLTLFNLYISIGTVFYFASMTVFLHVASLPDHTEPPKPKRKNERKLSWSKVKEMFGAWVPKPIEEHA